MKLLLILGVLLALCPCGKGQSILPNGDFEQPSPAPWRLASPRQRLSNVSPAHGRRCLCLSSHAKPHYVTQENLPVKAGFAYDLHLSVRTVVPNNQNRVHATLFFYDANSTLLLRNQFLHVTPTQTWTEVTGTAVAPLKAVKARLVITVDPHQGEVQLDNVSLIAQKTPLLGEFDDLQVSLEANGDLRLTKPKFTMTLAKERNFAISGLHARGTQRLSHGFYNLLAQDGASFNEFYAGNYVSKLTLERRDGTVALVIDETLPHGLLRKTYEFFREQPYFRLVCEFTATRNYQSRRFMLNLGFPQTMRIIASQPEQEVVYTRKDRHSWFHLPRPNEQRFVGYFDEFARQGMGVIGADRTNWYLLPGGLLSSSGAQGGFTLELNRWLSRDVRKADSLYLELFMAPVETVQELQTITRQISN